MTATILAAAPFSLDSLPVPPRNLPRAVAIWLRGLPQVTRAQACTVTIKGTVYSGAHYTETLAYTAGMDAVTRGDRKAGDTYTQDAIYLVGKLPAVYRHRPSSTAFRLNGDSRDWYISGYATPDVAADNRFARFHPFGASFMLRAWAVPTGEAIDTYATKPYQRIAATMHPAA